MALTLTRNTGQRVNLYVGGMKITVDLRAVEYGRAVLAIDAPKDVKIWREEIDPNERQADDPPPSYGRY